MSKFTHIQKHHVKSIVATSLVKRVSDPDILQSIFEETNKTISIRYLIHLKDEIKKESYKWLETMRRDQYEYVNQYRQRINEIEFLQKKHYDIIEMPNLPIPIKQVSLVEHHKLSITLSNIFDVAPFIIGNATTVSAPSEIKSTEPDLTCSLTKPTISTSLFKKN